MFLDIKKPVYGLTFGGSRYYVNYAEAFMRYTETNIHFPNYDLTFLLPDHLLDKFKIIFDGINAKPENKRTKRELIALARMYKGGVGCEKDEDKAVITLPIDADWAFTRIKNFIYTYDISLLGDYM